ncbi:MAG: hypothetical protein IJU19_08410 [Bacteroidales bacterium]|nr:hypothetical protein [Bacteroidales bacterium]
MTNENKNTSSRSAANDEGTMTATKTFFCRWWKLLVIVGVAAAVVSAVCAMLITPLYRSTAVMIPTNTNRMTKAIMDYDYSMDFIDYGSENNCEQALQMLTSKKLAMTVCEHFGLMQHYKIKSTSKHPVADFEIKWKKYFSARRTKYLGVQVSVLDKDPQLAADIANYVLEVYDSLCRETNRDRTLDAAMVMNQVCAAEAASLDSIAAHATPGSWQQQLVKRKCKKLAQMQARATQTAVECDLKIHYKYVIEYATAADKKDQPKRSLIVMAGCLGAIVMCIFALLIFVPRKEEENATEQPIA